MRKLYQNDSPGQPAGQPAAPVRTRRALRFALLLGFLTLLSLGQAAATHFRYGNVSWRVVQADPTGRTVEFKVTQAWQGTPAVGEAPYETMFNFGDRRTKVFAASATFVNAQENYYFAQATFTHVYPSAGNYVAYMGSCCRIPDLANNAGGGYNIGSLVNIGNGNSSPVSTLSPVVNVPAGMANATFALPANDPDGDPLTYTLATSADMGNIPFTQPQGLSIHPTTGVMSFNTTTKTVGQLYCAAVKVSDGKTSIILDFLLKLTLASSAPRFDYSLTPANNFVYQAAPGQTIQFTVKATDQDLSDQVTLQGLGLPPGSTMSAPLPTSGNPVQSTFSWTPTANNLGTSVINFVAQDSAGTQAYSSVTIQVSMRPVFNVPPTPLAGSTTQVVPGTPLQFTIQASDPDPKDRVQLVTAQNLPAAATLSAALPTVAANTTSTQFSWTPTVADWGKRAMVFTAADTYGEKTTHSFNTVVNTPPVISSTPVLQATVGQPYSYSIRVTDPDVAYGDVLKILATTKPAWLTLTATGTGTATLSGTPQATDAGTQSVALLTEDKYHHGYDPTIAMQAFELRVIQCNTTLTTTSTAISCHGLADGTIGLAVSGGTAPFAYRWTGPNGFTATIKDLTGLAAGTYTVTVTDANQCGASAELTLAEPAAEPVRISGPANVTVAATAGNCGAQVTYAAPQGLHSCQTVTTTLTAGLVSGSFFPVGTTQVVYRATTAADTAIYRFSVTVEDKSAPVVKTKDLTVTLVNGNASITAAQVDNGSGDACGLRSLSVSPASFTCANAGANQVTLTVTDTNGNVATAVATVTVVGAPTAVPAIVVTPTNTVYTGGVKTTLYLGYGPQSATLTASGGVQYAWSPAAGLSNPSSASPVFTANAAGVYTYSVTITNQYGCTAVKTVTMKVVEARCGNGNGNNDKVLVCHNGHEICISANAVPAHLSNHQDTLGSCEDSASEQGKANATDDNAGQAGFSVDFEALPNPFATSTTLHFRSSQTAPALVRVYDWRGAVVATLYNGVAQANREYSLAFDGRGLNEGLYLCQLLINGKVETQRLQLAR